MALPLVFMGTPDFAVPTLDALVKAGHSIKAVYSQPPRPAGRGQKETPSPVHRYALEHGIPVYTPSSLKSPEVQQAFAAHNAQAAIVIAYGLLLPKPILEAYPLGCINVHPSLLPRWRGAAPIQRTLMAGDKETAICTMQMNEGLDTGDILLIEKFSLAPGTTAGELHDHCAVMAGPLVLKTLEAMSSKALKPTPQSNDGATYAPKISKAECQIDWTQTAHNIDAHIHGLSPFPGAYFTYNKENIKVLKALPLSLDHHKQPGEVLDEALTVACGKGAIKLLELQRPGKKAMKVADFLRGFPLHAGTHFH